MIGGNAPIPALKNNRPNQKAKSGLKIGIKGDGPSSVGTASLFLATR
jgi:hypothetical protein